MSEANGQAWGMCAAFGCPLFGSVGSDGKWFCFCHVGRPTGCNDAITAVLNGSESPVVELTKAIRRDSLRGKSDETSIALRALKAHPKFGILGFARDADGNARAWLQRLERHLIEVTDGLGERQGLSNLAPTAPVIGPTHASNFHPYADSGEPA